MGPLRIIFLYVARWQMAVAARRAPMPVAFSITVALSVTVVLVGLNLLTAAILLGRWWHWGRWIGSSEQTRLAVSFFLVLIVGAVQYAMWVSGGRFGRLMRSIERESPSEHRARRGMIVAYLVASVTTLLLAFSIMDGLA